MWHPLKYHKPFRVSHRKVNERNRWAFFSLVYFISCASHRESKIHFRSWELSHSENKINQKRNETKDVPSSVQFSVCAVNATITHPYERTTRHTYSVHTSHTFCLRVKSMWTESERKRQTPLCKMRAVPHANEKTLQMISVRVRSESIHSSSSCNGIFRTQITLPECLF